MPRPPLDLTDPLVGQQLSSFRIDKVIKRGGMAQVYKGWDVMLERPVAIKVIDTRFRSNPSYAERFLREARAVATWRHEHIVQVYYADVQDGLYYFAMEYVDGLDLAEVLARYLADGLLMPQQDVLRIGRAVADALTYAHQHGVVHRDVKPSNVMLSADGRILLADFGLAMVVDERTETEFLGTPHYIAPEQAIRAGNAVPQSDLYSLGVMLYEMLAGAPPFDDPSLTGLAFQHINDPPVSPRSLNPALNRETEQVLLKALSKEPTARYQTGDELMTALEKALATGYRVPGGWVDLPPLPAGVSLDEAAGSLAQFSDFSVVQQIAHQLAREEQDTVRTTLQVSNGWRWLAVLGVAVLLLSGWLWWRGGVEGETAVFSSTSPAPTQLSDEPLPAPVLVTETTVVALATQPLTTPTPMPTSVPPPTATATVSPKETAVPPAPTLAPLPALDGPPVQFFYNSRSFYALNAGSVPLDAAEFSFLAIDKLGNPAGYSFVGQEWAEFYPQIDPGSCTRIEPIAYTSFTRPEDCQSFNALVTPSLLDDTLFWLPHDNVVMFEVFWNGSIIGRCPVDVDRCTLRLPKGAEQFGS